MAKFEAHITCDREHSDNVREVGHITGWKYSAFDADPVMGDKPFAYLTQYGQDANNLLLNARRVAMALTDRKVPVLRVKIERIVYDQKTGVDEIGGGPV